MAKETHAERLNYFLDGLSVPVLSNPVHRFRESTAHPHRHGGALSCANTIDCDQKLLVRRPRELHVVPVLGRKGDLSWHCSAKSHREWCGGVPQKKSIGKSLDPAKTHQ
ncbi:MAG: hypothetical protein IIB04_01190 [Acidobacteria bacterium]|nr:hypothetical protein [Acidobacteriota bacterium]